MKRQVTDHPVGVITGVPRWTGPGSCSGRTRPAAKRAAGTWSHSRLGRTVVGPFREGIPQGWDQGLAQAGGVVAAGISDRDGFAVHVSVDGEPAKELVRSTEAISIGGAGDGFNRAGLSADGSMLCLEHAEHGDLIHPALRVVDPRTGAVVAEQVDQGMALRAAGWSPVPGDQRLVVIHERQGDERACACGTWRQAIGMTSRSIWRASSRWVTGGRRQTPCS